MPSTGRCELIRIRSKELKQNHRHLLPHHPSSTTLTRITQNMIIISNNIFLLFLISKVKDRRFSWINTDQFTMEVIASGQIKCTFRSVITEIRQSSKLPSFFNSLLLLCSLKFWLKQKVDFNTLMDFTYFSTILGSWTLTLVRIQQRRLHMCTLGSEDTQPPSSALTQYSQPIMQEYMHAAFYKN